MANFIKLTEQNSDTSMQRKTTTKINSMTRFDITMSIDVMLAKLHSVLQHSHTLGPVVFSPLDGPMALQNLKVRKPHIIHNTWRSTSHKNFDKEKPQIPLLLSSNLTLTLGCFGGRSLGGCESSELISPKMDFTNLFNQQIYSGRRIL